MHHFNYPKREPKPTIRVLMLKDAVGAPDGITRTEYQAGQEYDLPEDLAGCFFSTHSADPAEAHQQPETPQIATQDGRSEPEEPAPLPKEPNKRHGARQGRGKAS